MPRNGSSEAVSRSFLSIGALVKGTGLTFVIVLIGAVLLGLIVSLTEWEGFSHGLGGFTYVSIGLGAMFAAKQSQRHGWLHGGLVGVAYHTLSSLFFQDDFSWQQLGETSWLITGMWSFVAGTVGGILGVNS